LNSTAKRFAREAAGRAGLFVGDLVLTVRQASGIVVEIVGEVYVFNGVDA
jgi:hypothetical protein